jgi:hypothetical protein
MKVPMDHPEMLWLIEHTASILNRLVAGDDGQTAYQRLHGRRANKKAVEIGEKLFDYISRKLRTEMNMRWRIGMYLGVVPQSGEHFVGTWNGDVIRTRSIVRIVESSRWDTYFLVKLKGTPSKPIHNGVDRYGRFQDCEDPHAMIEVDPVKHAQQKFDH